MAAAAAAARSMPISDVLRLRVHVLNAPGAGGGDAVRSGGRQQSAVVQLLTTMSPQSDIYHLKTRVEHQFASLFPSAPPLVVRAVQDQDNFLLPDELVVGAVLTQNDPVNIIAEGGVFQGSEPEAVAEQRWDASRIVTQCLHWTEHSSMFFGANPFGSPPAVEVTNEVVLMLCDLCVSAREKTRDMACLGLGKFGAYLRSGLQIKDASIRNVCAAARRSTVRRTSEALAIFLQRLAQLDDGRHAAAMARTGGREAAMSLASGKDSSGPTQTAAMEVLMVLDKLTHGEEHVNRQRPAVNPEPRYLAERKHKARLEKAALEQASGGRLAASQVGKNAQPNSKPVTFTFEGGSGAGANIDQEPASLLKTMAALLASKTADAPIYIADLINRSSTSPSFLHHIETTPKAVALLATIVNSTDAVGPSAEAVAKLTTELCRNHQGRRCLCNRAPFALLSSLAMSRDEAVRTHAIASIREICHDDSLPLLPTEWLLALTRCPVIEAQRSAARALWLLSERDVDNLMSRHVLAIVALASADDPFIQSNAGKALGSLCVKEVNKKMIVRAGGAEVFINLLRAATTDIEVQRFAAKALANLSSSDRDTRSAVIRQVEERIPSWTEFDDNIVNVYLEMMFTN